MNTQKINIQKTNPTLQFDQVKVDNTWQKYDLLQYPIKFEDSDTKLKAIVRKNGDKNELINILGKGYTLLPNEEAIKLADEAADLAGFKRFKMPNKFSWYQQNIENDIMYNREQTVMHAFYLPEGKFDNGEVSASKGDKVNVGVDIVNSINGKKSFGVSIFSFRSVCSNGVIFGYEKLSGGISHAHTKSISAVVAQLKTSMLSMMDKANDIMSKYQVMTETKITVDMLEKLKKLSIPKTVKPSYLLSDETQTLLSEKLTTWKIYNDVTENIWHNAKTDIGTKELQFRRLHKIILPQQIIVKRKN